MGGRGNHQDAPCGSLGFLNRDASTGGLIFTSVNFRVVTDAQSAIRISKGTLTRLTLRLRTAASRSFRLD